jgi:hypothetical protein
VDSARYLPGPAGRVPGTHSADILTKTCIKEGTLTAPRRNATFSQINKLLKVLFEFSQSTSRFELVLQLKRPASGIRYYRASDILLLYLIFRRDEILTDGYASFELPLSSEIMAEPETRLEENKFVHDH